MSSASQPIVNKALELCARAPRPWPIVHGLHGADYISLEMATSKRDKLNLHIFWLRDKNLEDNDGLCERELLVQEIETTSKPT